MKNQIKTLREAKSISQNELGKRVGVSRQTINSLENGRYNPSIELAFKISFIFNLPIEKIFIYEEKKDGKE
ncbi:helix-turn-helix transcriptional regulator [Mycoplasmatota bacterium WC44]